LDICVICGNPADVQWTLDDGSKVYVAQLCALHAKPLEAIGAATGTKPKTAHWVAPTAPPRRRHNRLEPLTGWKPPEELSGPEVLFGAAT
jgi:hypothetical protein